MIFTSGYNPNHSGTILVRDGSLSIEVNSEESSIPPVIQANESPIQVPNSKKKKLLPGLLAARLLSMVPIKISDGIFNSISVHFF